MDKSISEIEFNRLLALPRPSTHEQCDRLRRRQNQAIIRRLVKYRLSVDMISAIRLA